MARGTFAMPEREDGGESLAHRMIEDIHASVRDIDVTLRGERGENGLVSRVKQLELAMLEMQRAMAEDREARRLKVFPAEAEETAQARWKAIAIWGGVALAFLGAAVSTAKFMMEQLGGTP